MTLAPVNPGNCDFHAMGTVKILERIKQLMHKYPFDRDSFQKLKSMAYDFEGYVIHNHIKTKAENEEFVEVESFVKFALATVTDNPLIDALKEIKTALAPIKKGKAE